MHPEEAGVARSLDLVANHLELINGLGEEVGASMAPTGTGPVVLNRAIESGVGAGSVGPLAAFLRGEGR